MTGIGEQLGPAFAAAETYDVPSSDEPYTLELAGGHPVAFRFRGDVAAVSLELEGPGKVVVPTRTPDAPKTFAVSGTTHVSLDETSLVGLELEGPEKIRIRTVINPPAHSG